MNQQLGIVLMIDSAAAIESGSLDGHIYLIDNAKGAGSTGEATGHLVSMVRGTCKAGQASVEVLNWLPYGVASPPPTLPQTFFLEDSARELLTQRAQPAARAMVADTAAPAEGALHPVLRPAPVRLPRKVLDVLGREIRPDTTARLGSGTAEKPTRIHYPNPVITNILGEAVDLRVIYPAQYGSPDLFTDGLYWSATVDTNKVGYFSYTLYVTLFYAERIDGEMVDCSVTLPYVAYLDVKSDITTNGFCHTPAVLPA